MVIEFSFCLGFSFYFLILFFLFWRYKVFYVSVVLNGVQKVLFLNRISAESFGRNIEPI